MSDKEQANSFSCKICSQVFTEESGAYYGFTCENCITDLENRATGEIEDNECSHVFHTIKEIENDYDIEYYYYCECCDQIRKEIFDKEEKEVIEVLILREGFEKE